MRQPAPAPAGIVAFSRAYPGRPDQIRAVRSDLRALLASCPMRADIILCASELATNAAVHSRSRLPGAQFTIRIEIHPGDYTWIAPLRSPVYLCPGSRQDTQGQEFHDGHFQDVCKRRGLSWQGQQVTAMGEALL
jgi:hypothetical protein